MADDLNVTLGFQGEDDGASALTRQLVAALKQLRAEDRAARAEESRARKQASDEAAAESRTRQAVARSRQQEIAAERAAARAQQDSERATRRNADALRAQGAAADSTGRLVGALSRRVAALVASLGVAFSAQRAIASGLSFNETIETSTLGIASLINAETALRASDGQLLEGQDKLTGAFTIATEQVTKLRIAGLQTAATTIQLVQAFQQAVGAGVAAGLQIDQVRQITVLAVQAATSLGVPLNQLNQEVRALLDGTIDRNARVATALRITAADVKSAREAGTLFDFLSQKLGGFAISGEAVSQTMAGVRSNVQETLQTFAAFATAPLFERIKTVGLEVINSLFDTANLQIRSEFQGLVQFGEAISETIGTILGNTVRGLLTGAQRLGEFFQNNELNIRGVLAGVVALASAVGGLVGDLARMAAEFIGVGQTGEATRGVLFALAGAIQVVRANLGLLLTGILAYKAAGLLPALLALTPGGLAVTGVAVAVAGLATALGVLQARRVALRLAEEQRIRTLGDETAKTITLTHELDAQASLVNSGKLKGNALLKAREDLHRLTQQLIDQSPAFSAALADQTTSLEDALKAQQALNGQRLSDLQIQTLQAENEASSLAQEQRAFKARLKTLPEAGADNALRVARLEVQHDLDGVNEKLDAAVSKASDLRRSFEQAFTAVHPPEAPAVAGSGAPNAGTTGEALEKLVAANTKRIQQDFDRQSTLLKEQLADGLLSYRAYYDQLTALTTAAIDQQITEQRRLLAGAENAGARAQVQQRIDELREQRASTERELTRQRLNDEKALGTQIAQVFAQTVELEGDSVRARSVQLAEQFRDLLTRLRAEGNTAGVALVERLINLDLAKARLQTLERDVQGAQDALTQQERHIELAQQTGAISATEAQRQLADAYRATAARIRDALPALRQFAQATGDPAAAREVDRLAVEADALEQKGRELADTFTKFRNDLRQAFTSDLSDALAHGEENVNSFGEAVGRVLERIGQSIRELLAQRAAEALAAQLFDPGKLLGPEKPATAADTAAKAVTGAAAIAPSAALLTQSATQLTAGATALGISAGVLQPPAGQLATGGAALGAAALALTPVVPALGTAATALLAAATQMFAAAATLSVAKIGTGFAHGGYIGGPSSPVDSIPIWVTGGEYVINPESTRRHRRLLEVINRDRSGAMREPALLLPIARHSGNRFARGGLVRDAAAGATASRAVGRDRASLEVDLAPDVVARHLRTSPGEDAWLDVAVRKQKTLRQILGLPPGRG